MLAMDADALERLRAAGSWMEEPEVCRFLATAAHIAADNPARRTFPSGRLVIELGGFRMHDHDPRPTWPDAAWIGVDHRPGPGVDVVGLAHEVPLSGGADVVLSVSALEHDPHWELTLATAVRLTRPGGIVAMTCAGPGWPDHELDCAPGSPHYRNVTCGDAEKIVQVACAARGTTAEISTWYEARTVGPEHPYRTCLVARIGSSR